MWSELFHLEDTPISNSDVLFGAEDSTFLSFSHQLWAEESAMSW
jgi:hypothetical protein